MSRLLFAAARGARVQRPQVSIDGKKNWWQDTSIQWGLDDELRIHPEDEHLQYGPISTALREFAADLRIEDKTITGLPIFMLPQVVTWYNLARNTFDDKTHRALFLLILAEALADEGL